MRQQTLLRLPTVQTVVGLGKTSIYELIRQGRFPRPVQISLRAVGWRSSDIDAFVASRPTAASK